MERSRHIRARRSKAKKPEQRTWLEQAKELQRKILTRRGGELLPDSAEEIRAMREGRVR